MHVRSGKPDALPLIMTHGWPSSPVEFLRVVEPLTDSDTPDAFDLVIPSLPGYGMSPVVSGTGWGNLFRVAQAWAELMTRLGYERYGAQSTDAGAGVAALLAMVDGERMVGSHLTGTAAAMPFGPPLETDGLTEADQARARSFNAFQEDGMGYLHLQATRPQTLAYALTDSPVAQLAWIVEKFQEWTDPAAELPDDAVDRDQLLTNVSLTWFNRAGASSAHATYEGIQAWRELVAGQGDDSSEGGWDAAPVRPASRLCGVRRRQHHPQPGRPGRPGAALVGVRHRWPLSGDGGPGPPGRGRPHLLPSPPLSAVVHPPDTPMAPDRAMARWPGDALRA